jgi:hypothetical protein
LIKIAITSRRSRRLRERYRSANVAFENKIDENGDRLIWLDPAVVDRLGAMPGAGESFSDVIVRIAAQK